jgi:hypothetical protein
MKKHLLFFLLLCIGALAYPTTANAQLTHTVYDGTIQSYYVPAYIFYFDDFTKSQFVIPAADLSVMAGGTISSIKFYTTSNNVPYTSVSTVDVYLMEVGYTSISAYEPKTSATMVYQGTLSVVSEGDGGSLTINFTTPYAYSGGNLLVGIENTTDAGYKTIYFYGTTVAGASIAASNSSSLSGVTATQRNFIPKTTFTYTPGGSGPMCLDPTGVTSSNVTTNSATISWNAPAAGDSPQGYQVCCLPSADAFDAATATWTNATGTSHTFTGLTAGTAYTAHVRSVCGTDFYSNGNAFTTFTTPFCNAADQCSYTFSLADDFGDGWNGASIRVMQGENQVETITLSSGSSNTVTVSLCPNVLISLIWDSGSYDYEASFTLTDPYGVQLYECTDCSTLTNGTVFYSSTVSCAPITCFPPTGLHASVTTNSATIGWDEVAENHIGYQAEWDGSVLPGLSGNPFSFTGLSPASTHTVRVRTVCAAGDTSNWSAPHTFTTDCPPYTTYPYIEGFEDVDIPTCWRSIDGDGDGEEWHTLSNPTDVSYSHAGDYHITSYSTTYSGSWLPLTPNNWLLSPPFTLPSPCNLSLVWYAKSQDPDYLEPLDILMSTTGSDTAAFTTTVLSLATVPGEYTQYTYSLANYAGQTVTFAFVHRNVSDRFRVNLDDVGVLEIPTVVTSDATNIDIYTASLNGSVTGQALTAYGFEWKATADSEYERDTVSTGNHTGSISFNLANLDPATSYTFRTFAAVEGIIFYGDEKTFTTEQLPCPAPANLTVTDVDHESATLTWVSQLPTVGSYNVYLDNVLLTQPPISALTYPLTGLNPGTSYEVRVVTVCEGTEGLFDTKTFSTPCIRVGCFAIGDTNSTSSYYWLPVNTYYNYSYTQQLFLASEMGSANLITNIAFKYAYSSPTTKLTNVKIYMGHTTKDVFASNTDTVPFADLTEVYSGNLNCSQGWNTFELDQPFSYNGTDNLVLALFDNVYGYDGNLYQFVCATAGGDRALDYYSDSQVPNPANLSSYTGGKGIRSFRNVVKFGYCDNSTCVPPTVSVDNVTAHDAEVSWTPGYQESAWGMQYKGENDNDWTTVTLTPNSANPYTLTNLAANTNYTVQMWSLCGNNEVSEITEKTFTTLVSCPAPTTLASTTVTATDATLTWTSVGTPGSFEVEYNDGENTFSTVVNAVSTTTQQTTTLTGLSANTAYTARVRAICGVGDTSNWSNTASFTTLISCPSPTVPVVLDKTANSATISWTPGGTEGEWDVYYSWASPTDPTLQEGSTTYTINATSYTFTGLNANTTYSAHVRAVCGNGDVSDYVDVQFTTPCGSVSVPYAENFDNYTQGISTGTTNPTGYPAVDMPSCWTFLNRSTTIGSYPMAFLTSSTTYAVSGNCLFFKSSSTTPLYAVLPEMSENLSELQLTFTYRNEGVSTLNGTLHVGYMTNLADVSTYVEMYSCSQTTTKTEVEVNFNTVTVTPGTPYYIVFKYEGGSSNAYYLGIDNVSVDYIPACPAPTSLAASNETADGATLTWTAVGTPSSFEVEYNDGENTFSTVVNANPTTTQQTTTLTGLSSITDYLVRVRAICGVGDTSAWSNMASFTTACAVFTAPYTEDFTGFNTLVSACWKRYSGAASSTTTSTSDLTVITSNTTGWIFNNQNVFGQGHVKLNIYGTIIKYWLVTPAIDISTLTNPELTFDLALTAFNSTNPVSSSTTQADDKFIVFISTDNGATWSMNNATVWDNVGGDYVYNNISATGERISIPLNQYAGQTIKIAFYGESTVGNNGDNDVHIDNISVDERPSCPVPAGVTVSNVTATSATLTWTPGGNETDWDLYVADITVDPTDAPSANSTPTAMVQNNPTYTLTGLTTSHIYKAYVRADCGNDGVSEWSNPVTFVPGSYNMGSVRTLTTCSAIIYDDGGVDGNYGFNRNDTLTIYPAVQGNLVQVSGTISVEGNSYDYLRIYDGVGTTDVLLYDNSTTRPHTIQTITSTTGPLTLYFHSDDVTNYAGLELNVACVPPCEAPLEVVGTPVSNNQSVLTFGYNQQAQAVNLELQYKAANATNWSSSILVQDITYTLTGLDNNTTYDVRVRSVCGNADAPYYSQWVNGTISIACPTPMALTASDETVNSAALTWTTSGTPDGFDIEYGPVGFAHGQGTSTTVPVNATSTTQTTDLTNLSANTTYEVYVRAVCGNDHSEWSTAATFRTPQVLATLPYTQDWESATENANWTLLNGTQTNQWTVGSATSNGGQSLYVSNDDGVNNAYTLTSTSTVWAYRDIQFGAANAFQLSFDWKCNGEGTTTLWDYLGVYIGTPGDVTVGSVTPPTGVDLIGKYNLQSDWQNVSVQLDGSQYSNTTKRLYFLWRNDDTQGAQSPAAVDNISITAINCVPPTAFTTEDVTTTEVMFSVTGVDNVLGYQVEYGATGFAHGQGTMQYEAADATPPTIIVVNGLTANTAYDFYVRTICSVGDTSEWSAVSPVKTNCNAINTFPWNENFDAVSVNTLPDCWTNTNDVGSTSWKVTNSINGSISAYSGSNVMRMYQQGHDDQASLQMPTFDLTTLNNPMVGFWYTNKAWGNDQDVFAVYYRTSPSDAWTE